MRRRLRRQAGRVRTGPDWQETEIIVSIHDREYEWSSYVAFVSVSPQYRGKNLVRGYCNWYGVDALSAVIEFRQLGVSISAEREDELRKSAVRRTAKRQKCDHQKKIEKPGVS